MPISMSLVPTPNSTRNKGGYIVTITVEEGVQYTVAAVNVDFDLPDIDGALLAFLSCVCQAGVKSIMATWSKSPSMP